MKFLTSLTLLFLIFGCKEQQVSTPYKDTVDGSNNLQEIYKPIDYLDRVKPTDGRFLLTDLTKEFYLVFGLGSEEPEATWKSMTRDSLRGYIVNPSEEEFSNFRELRAQRGYFSPKNDSLPIARFENSLIIPFTAGEDLKCLTVWNILSSDSIEFDLIMQPALEAFYSNIVSIEVLEVKDSSYLAVYLQGGEGGENWDELIVAKFEGLDQFNVLVREGVGYCHDCGNWAKIVLEVTDSGFVLTERRDSMTLVNDQWDRVWTREKLLKRVGI